MWDLDAADKIASVVSAGCGLLALLLGGVSLWLTIQDRRSSGRLPPESSPRPAHPAPPPPTTPYSADPPAGYPGLPVMRDPFDQEWADRSVRMLRRLRSRQELWRTIRRVTFVCSVLLMTIAGIVYAFSLSA